FLGNAPATDGQPFSSSYGIYKIAGTTGWGGSFGGNALYDYDLQFNYSTNADGTLTLVGLNNAAMRTLLLPATQLGRLVTGIGPRGLAFDDVSFSAAIIPAGITNIAPDAFAGMGAQIFVVEGANPACTSIDGSLYDSTLTRLLAPADRHSFHLPATVTNLVPATFGANYNLAHISVDPANLAFRGI